jgi:alginate O-acetyltransferase complex protein AlgI
MLFNSYSFVFAFLPLSLLIWLWLKYSGKDSSALVWLTACSVLFYAIWRPANLLIIVPSLTVNYWLALKIQKCLGEGESGEVVADRWLVLGVLANLCFLGYFKYMNFFLGALNDSVGTSFQFESIALPLGISFITFQKIGFLVDVRSSVVKRFNIKDFLIFVFFFPQLIAGPIVHYKDMMPQFSSVGKETLLENIAVGLMLFSVGLFKKVILADGISKYANGAFGSVSTGLELGVFDAWSGVLAYTLQIYFDFSGYSDMALGLARMFGIVLPMNFNSPFKATSIIEFWGRWHVTLTTFLTAYVYTPIVMRLTRARMKAGKSLITRKQAPVSAFLILVSFPTVLTMAVSGLWHGAGYTFLIWGLLHGLFLTVNHAWRLWRPKFPDATYKKIMSPIGWVLTFLGVVIGMVFFRADSAGVAVKYLGFMSGSAGAVVPEALIGRMGAVGEWLVQQGIKPDLSSGSAFIAVWIVGLMAIALLMPNSLEMSHRFQPALKFRLAPTAGSATLKIFENSWSKRTAFFVACFLVIGVSAMNRVTEFLYWQF